MPSSDRFLSGFLAVACTAGIVSCIPGMQPDPRLEKPNPAAADARLVSSSNAVAGEWDIVEFNGYRPRRLSGSTRAAFVDFDSQSVALQIECNISGVTGRVRDGVFVATPGDRIQTLVGCGRAREKREVALFGLFEQRPAVAQLPDGRLVLWSGNDKLVLERPEKRRLAYLPSARELMGEWRPVELTRFLRGRGYAGIGLSEFPGQVTFDGIEAAFDGCPEFSLRYRLSAEGRIEKIGGAELPEARRGCDVLRDQFGGRDMPQPWDMIRVLHANPMVEKVDDNTLLVSTEEIGLVLMRID